MVLLLNTQWPTGLHDSCSSSSLSPHANHQVLLDGTTSGTRRPLQSEHDPRLAIQCSSNILRAFLFLWHRRSTVSICHLVDAQAFQAAMVILNSAWETHDQNNLRLAESARLVFVGIQKQNGGMSLLHNLAVERITEAFERLAQRRLDITRVQ